MGNHPHPGDRQVGRTATSPWTFIRDSLRKPGELLSALTLLGLAVYAVTWVAYSGFYGEFGLRPEDVGLTYTAILIRSGVGVATLAIVFLVPVVLMEIIYSPNSPDYPEAPWGYYMAWQFLMIWLAIWWFLPDDLSRAPTAVLAVGTILLVVFILLYGPVDGFMARAHQRMKSQTGIWRILTMRRIAALILILLIAAVLNLPRLAGRRIAQSVKEVHANTGGLDVQVFNVDVVWLGTRPAGIPAQPEYLHLGQADETTVLYEAVGRTTYRVPSQAVIVTFSR